MITGFRCTGVVLANLLGGCCLILIWLLLMSVDCFCCSVGCIVCAATLFDFIVWVLARWWFAIVCVFCVYLLFTCLVCLCSFFVGCFVAFVLRCDCVCLHILLFLVFVVSLLGYIYLLMDIVWLFLLWVACLVLFLLVVILLGD